MTKIRQFFGNFTKWEFNGILKFLRLDASLNEKLNLSSNILKSRDNCNQYGRDDQSCSSVASIVEETEAPCYFVIVISANIQLTDIILNVVSQSYILGSWTTTFVVISWNVSPKSFQCTQAFSCHHSLSCNPEIKDYFLFILWFFFFFFFLFFGFFFFFFFTYILCVRLLLHRDPRVQDTTHPNARANWMASHSLADCYYICSTTSDQQTLKQSSKNLIQKLNKRKKAEIFNSQR